MKIQVLIADDHEATRRKLGELIQMRDGWEVCASAENGLEAIAKARQSKPDIIILDLAMPSMNGLTAALEIGTLLPATPIVLYTICTAGGLDLEARKFGIRRVVSKPNSDALFRTIEELVKEGRLRTIERKPLPISPGTTP
jgi:DNA-binding NarL/FixJ family response regulator